MITILKKARGKNTFEQDTKTRDEGTGHTTKRGSKLSVPLIFFWHKFTGFCGLIKKTCYRKGREDGKKLLSS